jgi:hypothetical protein
MKPTAAIASVALTILLAGCDSSPKVDIKDANASEVSDAVAKSGIAGDEEFRVRPGKWESKVAIEEIDIPGIPESVQETMKKTISERQPSSFVLPDARKARSPRRISSSQDNKCRTPFQDGRWQDRREDAATPAGGQTWKWPAPIRPTPMP